MKLCLRTDNPIAEVYLYDDLGVCIQKHTWEAHRLLAATLLKTIYEVLQKVGKEWNDIDGIVVYGGPGSFTGLRIGVSVANALGYSNAIPVVAASGEDWLSAKLPANFHPTIPQYGAEAHITQPKK